MCLELTYANSPGCGLVEFSYLAVGDKIIINKSHVDADGEELINTHSGLYESSIWVQWDNKDGNPVLTAVLNYTDLPEYEGSLNESLNWLSEQGLKDDLVDNIFQMYTDAIHNAGFSGTFIDGLLRKAIKKSVTIHWRIVDFRMNEPSKEDIH